MFSMSLIIFHYFPWRQLWVVHHDQLHYKLVHHNCNIFLKYCFSRRNVRHSQVLNVHFVLFIRLVIIITNHVTCDGPDFSRLNYIRNHKTSVAIGALVETTSLTATPGKVGLFWVLELVTRENAQKNMISYLKCINRTITGCFTNRHFRIGYFCFDCLQWWQRDCILIRDEYFVCIFRYILLKIFCHV